jgi:hypothetical protein
MESGRLPGASLATPATEPVQQLRLTRHGGSPWWSGPLLLALGGGTMLLRHYRQAAETPEPLVLALLAAFFAFAGLAVLARGYRQALLFDPGRRLLIVEEHTHFSESRRAVPFHEIAAVEVVREEVDDPDARPLVRHTHRAVARLRSGEELPLTDDSSEGETAARVCEQARALL